MIVKVVIALLTKIEELIKEGYEVTLTLKSGVQFKVNGLQDGPKIDDLGRFSYKPRKNSTSKTLITIESTEIVAYLFSVNI